MNSIISVREISAAKMLLRNLGMGDLTINRGMRQALSKFEGLHLNGKNFGEIIEQLIKIVPDMATAYRLFGLRGAPIVVALTTIGREVYEQDCWWKSITDNKELER